MVAVEPLRATLKDGNAANGSFGEGEATTDFRKRALGTGLRGCAALAIAILGIFGRPGDQSVPSVFPKRMGSVGDVTAPADGDSISLGSKETDSQNAWLRRVVSDASAVRLRGEGLVTVTRGDS